MPSPALPPASLFRAPSLPLAETPHGCRTTPEKDIKTVQIVEFLDPKDEPRYLEWARGIADAQDAFIASRGKNEWHAQVLIRDRAGLKVRFVYIFRWPIQVYESWLACDARKEWLDKRPEYGLPKTWQPFLGPSASRRALNEKFPIFDMIDDGGGSPERWRTAFLIFVQVFSFVLLTNYLFGLIPGWLSLGYYVNVLIGVVAVILIMELFTNRYVVLAARKVGFIATPPDAWGMNSGHAMEMGPEDV